jgi:hypothetical protein
MRWGVMCLMVVLLGGCDDSIERKGIGGACRRQVDCEEGLDCISKVCSARPKTGTPTSIDASIPTVPDGLGDAGTDGGD